MYHDTERSNRGRQSAPICWIGACSPRDGVRLRIWLNLPSPLYHDTGTENRDRQKPPPRYINDKPRRNVTRTA